VRLSRRIEQRIEPRISTLGVTQNGLVRRLMDMKRLASVLVMAMLAAGCGTDAGTPTTVSSSTTTSTPAATTTSPVATSVPAATTSTAAVTTTTSPVPTTLPGRPLDFGPAEGDILMVIGVRHDDVLNLRSAPGATQPIIGTIEPLEMGLMALGETRELPGALWIKVQHQEKVGWVHMGYVGYAGPVEDQTAGVVAELGGVPTAPTMTALGELVAGTMESQDVESDVVLVKSATVEDLGEIIYDVIGMADDAVRGARVHVFAEPVPGGFALKTVEVLVICGRGVDSGACT
jgi:hypothetical protein